MDIGPVRRRLTAEPLHSPVPGEESWVHEAPAHERTADERPPASPAQDIVPSTRARAEPAR